MKRAHRQGGAALVMALVVLLALLVIGVSAARNAQQAEKAARSERDRHIAFHAAESALADAETDIEGGRDPVSARAQYFARGSAAGFLDGCGADAALGLCLPVPAPGAPAWQQAALAAPEAGKCVEFGRFTGARLPTGHAALPARLPRYIIELMPFARAGEDAATRTGNFYRITAIGFGARSTTHVVLQTYYFKATSEGGA